MDNLGATAAAEIQTMIDALMPQIKGISLTLAEAYSEAALTFMDNINAKGNLTPIEDFELTKIFLSGLVKMELGGTGK